MTAFDTTTETPPSDDTGPQPRGRHVADDGRWAAILRVGMPRRRGLHAGGAR